MKIEFWEKDRLFYQKQKSFRRSFAYQVLFGKEIFYLNTFTFFDSSKDEESWNGKHRSYTEFKWMCMKRKGEKCERYVYHSKYYFKLCKIKYLLTFSISFMLGRFHFLSTSLLNRHRVMGFETIKFSRTQSFSVSTIE